MFSHYQEVLHFLFNSLPVYQKIGGKAMKLDLSNITNLCATLGNPQQDIRCIHIAGTNGKGSVSHMLAAAFIASGYRTGLYTSPHYLDFRERIRIDGAMIDEEKVVDFVNDHYDDFLKLKPSFFEMTVALAFSTFAAEKVDIAIVETGLGGRLDSTNIVDPIMSIITNVGLDHQAYLGNTISEIAQEKAGIIKAGRPCILGQSNEDVAQIVKQRCEVMGSSYYLADEVLTVRLQDRIEKGLLCSTSTTDGQSPTDSFVLPLHGLYQVENAQTALATLKVFNGLSDSARQGLATLTDEHIIAGLEEVDSLTGMQGRFEILRKTPLVIVDGGHNEDGMAALMHSLKAFRYTKLHLVAGFSKGKEIEKIIRLFPAQAIHYLCAADIFRAVPPKEIASFFTEEQEVELYDSVLKACEAALTNADPTDLILITGSIFVVAEALQFMKPEKMG
ncbi:MAG: bifunctional folylpolyglutamate synthase/dihydrofolate synthase [Saprospiraceae bacterium]|nr:bifunctional folylpolyglutamate synthase/dihydrofolate synthase [Saprospiraceae bacterium]